YYYDFADAVIIEKAEVTITLEAAKAQYASSDGVNPDRVRANEAVPHGVTGEAYLNPAVYPYELSYRYLVDGEWQELPPYNAGSYKVEVTFTPLFDINYKLTVQVINDAVIIEGADPTLFLEKKEISYTGKRVTSNNARAEGIAGGTAPRGTFQYLFARHGSGNFSMDPVINVNIDNGVNVGYDVKVTYIPGTGDNYKSYDMIFESALIVLPVEPRISFNPVTVNFTGEAFNFSKVAASVTGILGGSIPRGALSYEFVDNNGSRLDNPPVNSGVYNLKVIFTPDLSGSDNSTANYTSASEVFYGYVTINKVAPKISVTPRTFDFTNQPVTLAAEDIRVDGVNASFVPTGTVQVQYCPANGDEWSNEGPTQSGNYKVRVIYTAAEDENYINTVKIFNNILKIDNIMPVFLPLGSEQHIYNGASADVSFKPQIDGPAGKGTLSLSYRLNNGAPNNTWQGKVPKDVGEYDVRINYTMNASGDNYKSASQVFEKALIIVPREIKITPAFGQSKAYDGLPIEGIKYTVVYEGEDDFIKSITLKGALSAGDATDVGLYPITLGTLEIDVKNNGAGYANNFVIVLTDEVFYEISPAMAEITFSELSIERLIYSPGDRKSNDVHVTVIGNGRPIAHSFTILGDDENVGSFKAIVNILDSNFYADEADCVKEYKIIPADMDEVENIFENKKYTYSGNAITFAADRVYAGASVEYTYGTEKRNSAFSFKDVGVYEVTAVISKENYNTVTISATLTIVKAVPAVNVLPYTGELRYGDKLPTIACDNENGIIALDEGQVLVPGTHEYTWTFVPDDQDNYEIVTGKIYLTVEKAKTELLVRGANIQNASNPSRFLAQVASSGGILQDKVEIRYYDSEGNVYTQLPYKGGKYTVVVTYSGDEFYDASTFTDTVFVKEDPNYSWLYIAIGGIAGI
ncbi:MAG TPA: MBG domain-containing protein, partial [Clostridia bacterium]|nr:MBG domain-containing protein [Clostridia bacterium]